MFVPFVTDEHIVAQGGGFGQVGDCGRMGLMAKNTRRDKTILVTDLEEKFCQEYLKCHDITEAYRRACGGELNTGNVKAIWDRPNVQARLAVLRVQAVQAMKVEVNDIVKGIMEVYGRAIEAGDYTNANKAMELLGKHLGMFVERKEVKSNVDVHTSGEDAEKAKEDVKRLVGVLGQDNVVKLFGEDAE